jgi:Tol biopolymer transport system component
VVTATPAPENTSTALTVSGLPSTQIPVAWAHLNLSGKLVYVSTLKDGDTSIATLQMLDLKTGSITTLFSKPGAWIYYATLSPDAKQLIMSYSPGSQSNSSSNRILYSMPLDGSTPPQPLFAPPTADDRYTQVEWSSDGKYIYLVHYNHNEAGGGFYEVYEIYRMTYPNGRPEKILDRAFWPRVSADSTKLVYVSLDPDSGLNELFTANVDGTNSEKVAFSGPLTLDIIDAPVFSPDGKSILFSAPEPSQSSQPKWLEKLMGIQVAKAHNVPSDWWSVPISGGVPTQLTHLQTINLFASLSPDQQHIASLSGDGLFVMDLDGSTLTQLVSDPEVHGTVSWIP